MLAMLLMLVVPATSVLAVPQKGEPAPSFRVETTTGQTVSLASYRGSVLVVDFFAPWCLPCRESVPFLSGLQKKYGRQGGQILGMSIEDGRELREFITERQVAYPVALAGEELQTAYGLRSVPTLYVISKKGVIAARFQGYNSDIGKAVENLMKKLLAE